MKALFVGDVHNHIYMLDDVEKLDKKYKFDRIIFLGDYVDDWLTNNHISLETLEDIINMKKSNPKKYTLCLGNHELSYLGHPCSGHRYEREDEMYSMLKENIDCFDFFTSIKLGDTTYICSHAGFTDDYVANICPEVDDIDSYIKCLDVWNENKLDNLQYLKLCSYLRGGSNNCSSCVWADRRELLYAYGEDGLIFPNQIVGHSPVASIEFRDNLIFTDTHSTYRDGTPFGDKSYLIWNKDKFETIKRDTI